MMTSRRRFFDIKTIALLFAFVFALAAQRAHAKVYIDLAAPAVKKLPIAVQEFRYSGAPAKDQELARSIKNEILGTLISDLDFSNLFTVIGKDAHLDDPSAETPDFRLWRTSGADALIKGAFTIDGSRLIVEVRLFDCVEERQVFGKKYVGGLKNPARIVHYFADQLYEELTGRKGIFTTRLMFVSDKSGSKEVYMSDYDGRNAVRITNNRSINLSPQWSPEGKKMLYTSYKKGNPSLYMLDLTTGKDRAVSDKPGINISGRFSPDGGKVALTLSVDSSPELYTLDLNTSEYRRLTSNFGIDVSPSWSPDGKRLAFVSDISGNPHIFVLDLLTGNIKRITFNGKYNSSPAWSPDGKTIAFSRSESAKFNIWVMNPEGNGMAQLTFEGDNRSPSWSPDGRYIVFSSGRKGASSLYIMQADGTGSRKLNTGIGNEKSPVWSPYLQ